MRSINGACARRAAMLPVLLAAAVASVAAAGGQEGSGRARPLPPFDVVAPGGAAVPSTSLGPAGRWVVIYVDPGGGATESLLASLAEWRLPPDAARRIVLLVGGPLEGAAAYLSGKLAPESGEIAWFADAGGQAARALQLSGAPALHGVASGNIEWTLQGVLNDPAAYEPVLRTWIGAPPAAR